MGRLVQKVEVTGNREGQRRERNWEKEKKCQSELERDARQGGRLCPLGASLSHWIKF